MPQPYEPFININEYKKDRDRRGFENKYKDRKNDFVHDIAYYTYFLLWREQSIPDSWAQTMKGLVNSAVTSAATSAFTASGVSNQASAKPQAPIRWTGTPSKSILPKKPVSSTQLPAPSLAPTLAPKVYKTSKNLAAPPKNPPSATNSAVDQGVQYLDLATPHVKKHRRLSGLTPAVPTNWEQEQTPTKTPTKTPTATATPTETDVSGTAYSGKGMISSVVSAAAKAEADVAKGIDKVVAGAAIGAKKIQKVAAGAAVGAKKIQKVAAGAAVGAKKIQKVVSALRNIKHFSGGNTLNDFKKFMKEQYNTSGYNEAARNQYLKNEASKPIYFSPELTMKRNNDFKHHGAHQMYLSNVIFDRNLNLPVDVCTDNAPLQSATRISYLMEYAIESESLEQLQTLYEAIYPGQFEKEDSKYNAESSLGTKRHLLVPEITDFNVYVDHETNNCGIMFYQDLHTNVILLYQNLDTPDSLLSLLKTPVKTSSANQAFLFRVYIDPIQCHVRIPIFLQTTSKEAIIYGDLHKTLDYMEEFTGKMENMTKNKNINCWDASDLKYGWAHSVFAKSSAQNNTLKPIIQDAVPGRKLRSLKYELDHDLQQRHVRKQLGESLVSHVMQWFVICTKASAVTNRMQNDLTPARFRVTIKDKESQKRKMWELIKELAPNSTALVNPTPNYTINKNIKLPTYMNVIQNCGPRSLRI